MNLYAIGAIVAIALIYEFYPTLGLILAVLALLAMAKNYVQKYGISY